MAQLNDLLVAGSSNFLGEASFLDIVKLTTLNLPTTSNGTTYGPGSNGQVLKSNGSTVYWGVDNNPTLAGLGGIGAVTASGTSPLTLTAKQTGTSVNITGSVNLSWSNIKSIPATSISWSNRALTVNAAGTSSTASIPTTLTGFSSITSTALAAVTNLYVRRDSVNYVRAYVSTAGTAAAADGTAGTQGAAYITIGNSRVNTSVDEGLHNARGYLRIYGANTGYV